MCQGQVCLTCLRPTTSLTCLRLVSSYASYSAAQADRPLRRSLRLVSRYASLRLTSGPVPQPACWRVLRVCDWPQAQPSQQLATQPQPIQRPAQAQLSPASRSSRRNQHHNPAAQHHPWLRSLVAKTSFRPSPTSNPPKPTPPKPTRFQASAYLAPRWPHQPPLETGLSDLSGANFRYSNLPNTGFRCS